MHFSEREMNPTTVSYIGIKGYEIIDQFQCAWNIVLGRC